MESATWWRNAKNGTKSGGLTEGGDEWRGRKAESSRGTHGIRAGEHSTTFPRLGWQTFRGSRGKCLPAKDGFVRMPMPPFPPLSLSLFFSISSSVGWFNRETRNEKSAGTKSAKLRPILVVDSILLLLLLRKCVDIPTVMSYVKLSPTFSVTLVSPTYVF